MPITAGEAAQHITDMNKRIRTPIPAFLLDPERFAPTYIFNVGEWQWTQRLGSFGSFVIPACEPGKTHSEALVVPGIIPEEWDLADGQGRMSYTPWQGAEIAKEIVGMNATSNGLSPLTANLEWYGVFIAERELPSKTELNKAHAKVRQCMEMWLKDGDRLALMGDQGKVQIGPMHRKASAYLNQARSWAEDIKANVTCTGCGTPVQSNVARCARCNSIVNEELVLKLMKQEAELQQKLQAELSKPKKETAEKGQ